MKARIEIPKGWRRVRSGETRCTDRVFQRSANTSAPVYFWYCPTIPEAFPPEKNLVIRRVAAKGAKK